MIVLGVETSCDETSAAVLDNDNVRSNIISSQAVHSEFGGVVPEIASREHIRLLLPIVRRALKEADVTLKDVDGFAVTYGPGLVGALLVGLNFIKGLSLASQKSFVGVNHMEGHIYGNLLTNPLEEFPILFLIVSGGHTQLVLMNDHMNYQIVGKTRDDAVGEAFDKGGKMLGLGYPGGPEIDRLAGQGKSDFYNFPRAFLKDSPLDFSYSGLKTALLTYIQKQGRQSIETNINDVCASYQKAAVDILVDKTMHAARMYSVNRIAIAGGVAANSMLRKLLKNATDEEQMQLYLPELKYCTDNAAMIARAGMEYLKRGYTSSQNLNAVPSLTLNTAFADG